MEATIMASNQTPKPSEALKRDDVRPSKQAGRRLLSRHLVAVLGQALGLARLFKQQFDTQTG